MKNPHYGTNSSVHIIIALVIATLALPFIVRMTWADDYTQLKGYWQCQEDGETATLEFKSRQELLHNGEAYNYRLAPGAIQVQQGSDLVNYLFMMEGEVLVILSADGSVTQCQKATKPKQSPRKQKSDKPATPSRQAQSDDQHWPPPYVRPQGRIDENNPGAQALLYKFAGRWGRVTSNTLTNLFLKPDGTYEEVYESGYSGVFKDQGGYQSGNWGVTGAQQGRGRWKVVGGLRKGKLYLVDQNGKESVRHYEVHIRGGETFWGEYFFNGQLHSVKYIYR